jgi:hypothetical protein
MTIKEIAELCGVEVHTIRNWINKDDFLKENFTLRNHIKEKLESGSPEHPSDYDLGETLEIISEGGKNKTLASLLAENAVNKSALAFQNASVMTLFTKLNERFERLEAALASGQVKAIEDPQETQYMAIRRFLVENLNITGRRRDFVDLPDLWRRFRKVMEDMPLDMNALLYAVGKIRLDGITVVNKGAFRGLHGCRLLNDDY